MRGALPISERLYAALLHLYPKAFRSVYGRPMRLTFRDACRAAHRRSGAGGLLALWIPTLIDLLKSALEERARRGELMMSKSRLIALAGPLTIAVGALWVLTAIGDFAFRTVLDGDEAFLGLLIIPVFLSFVPLLFALIGARLRFHPSTGAAGRLGLALSVAGCAGLLVFLLASPLLNRAAPEAGGISWANYAAVVCVLSIRIGYILFGFDVLRFRLLPHGNLLPLLVGATVVLSLPFEWFGVPAVLPSLWSTPFLHFAVTGVCWVMLGIAMLEPRREPQTVAAI